MIAYGDHSRFLKSHPSDKHKSTNFITFHQNIRGLTHKIDELLISLSCINPQVLCVSEHHLWPDEINSVHLGHYTLHTHYCRRLYKQGGVAIFVSKNLEFQKIDLNQYVKEKDFEVCALNLQIATINLLILCLYRSPTGDYTYFLTQLESVLNKLYRVSTDIIVCGDFNINFLESTSRINLL
jgi:exonuclease III